MNTPTLKFGNKVITVSNRVKLVTFLPPIAPYTMRFEFVGQSKNFDPTLGTGDADFPYWAFGTWTHVTGSVYDWTYQNKSWGYIEFRNANGIWYDSSAFTLGVPTAGGNPASAAINTTFDNIEYRILGANLADVESLVCLFRRATKYLRSVALFDTSRVLIAGGMFAGHTRTLPQYLTQIPNFDFSGISSKGYGYVRPTDKSNYGGLCSFAQNIKTLITVPDIKVPTETNVYIRNAFNACTKVESGALSLYNKFNSAGWTEYGSYYRCFLNCGSGTETGAAELAQIPSGWK